MSYKTGNSNGTPSKPNQAREVQCEYDNITDRGNGMGSCGGSASTTGNITGIYDMNGGMAEHVMGYYEPAYKTNPNLNLPWGSNINTNQAGFTSAPNSKYYDSYDITSPAECTIDKCGGYALNETDGWYSDLGGAGLVDGKFTNQTGCWIYRGGYALDEGLGIFQKNSLPGVGFFDRTFRIVIS